MSMSFLPATSSNGCFSGCNSSCLATHWPLKWAYHQPFLRSSWSGEGRTKGTRKYRCDCGCGLSSGGGVRLDERGGMGGGGLWPRVAWAVEEAKRKRK